MDSFNRLITITNRTVANKKNEWVVIHYVGAVSTAENNAKYFYKEYRGASAHYFVDENSLWQVVEDKDIAWHVGTNKAYHNGARNNNSIGIELCCKKKYGNWYIEDETIDNAVWLTAEIMKKYNIPLEHLTTHFLTTGKICPEPFVREPKQWQDFKRKVEEALADIPEVTLKEKEELIKEFYNLDDNTVKYFEYYRYNQALIDKLYNKAKNSGK